ncbi:MAG: MMPL family transporter [Myxococcota bacterium]|nr:MMPL family transporter [Myxococcota bacterium]
MSATAEPGVRDPVRKPWRGPALMGLVVLVSLLSAWLTMSRLRVSADLTALFPESNDATALKRWIDAFGGSEPATVLVTGKNPNDVEVVAESIAESLRHASSVTRVIDRAPRFAGSHDPTLAWAYAGRSARQRLAALLTPDGMRERLRETRALLLAPATDIDVEAWMRSDPLRLAQVPWESGAELSSAVGATPGEPFSADEGRARLVVAEPRGGAFASGNAEALVEDVERAERHAARAGVTIELAGAHAIAWATERMLKRDLAVSGTLSLILASVAFVATFRRARALLAVLPPLVLGTLWTTGLAALLPSGLSAVAIAFAAVVVGVGVDTGVHVYAALLAARREGHPPAEAARRARASTWRPTLTAAAVAAVAFGALALGRLRAMKELGILCGAGELLTSLAILLVTPEVGAWLERGPPPRPLTPRWIDVLIWTTATRRRALFALSACSVPFLAIAWLGWPSSADAMVAIRPRSLPPLVAEARVRALFGSGGSEWIVLSADAAEQRARERADRVAEALEPLVQDGAVHGFDTLTAFAPALATQELRIASRDALDLPSRRPALEAALRGAGFELAAFASALESLEHPSQLPSRSAAARAPPAPMDDALAWLLVRHLAHDGPTTLVATYVRPGQAPGSEARVRAAIVAADPAAQVTGFDAIDRALREVLGRDLAVVGGAAMALVSIALCAALRSARHAAVALSTLACEMALVGVFMRIASVHWHVYDALVLPVLFGVTIDESMFLLDAARLGRVTDVLRTQGPLVAATGLTTAAGFVALVACRFDGLLDLGAVGTAGVLAGLLAALVIVPAALRVIGPQPPC